MHLLSRRVRISLTPAGYGPSDNRTTVSGPLPDGMEAFCEIEVGCGGSPDPTTGYVMNISEIDEAVRALGVPVLRAAFDAWAAGSRRPAGEVLADVLRAVSPRLGGSVVSVRWWPSPYHWLLIEASAMDRVLISRQFEFSAAHRLHSADLTDEQNRAVFGKCNNPSGHGHNYKLEAVVSVPLAEDGRSLGFSGLGRLVDEHVIERFDHKHLNLDTAEFAQLIPSVEHIARVCHDVLEGPVAAAGATLIRVTVWETDKTSCTYPASAAGP